MRRRTKYVFLWAFMAAIGCYFLVVPEDEDIDPSSAQRDTATTRLQGEPPATLAAIEEEETEYAIAERLASLEGWRAFLTAHPNGAHARWARAEVDKRLSVANTPVEAPVAPPASTSTDQNWGDGIAERLGALAAHAQSATTKVKQLLLTESSPARDNAEVLNGVSSHMRESNRSTDAVLATSGDAVPTMAAAAVTNSPSPDEKPADDAARAPTLHAETDGAAGTQLAALTPDEVCRRDGDRLEQLRSNPSSDELVHFANELGCRKLLPRVVSLMKSLAPRAAEADVSNGAPLTGPTVGEDSRPASPSDVAPPTSNETCKRDADRLTQLRSNPSGEEAERFARELSCEALRPQLQRLMESLGLIGPPQPAASSSSSTSGGSLTQICASERAALDRLRKEPSAEAVGLFWRDLKCEGLRPQIRLLMESLNVAPDTAGSPREAKSHEAASSSALSTNEADPVACRRETAELNNIRATLDLGEARRFASAVTCGVLKLQAARLLESLRE